LAPCGSLCNPDDVTVLKRIRVLTATVSKKLRHLIITASIKSKRIITDLVVELLLLLLISCCGVFAGFGMLDVLLKETVLPFSECIR
jgi:hypothetical protein